MFENKKNLPDMNKDKVTMGYNDLMEQVDSRSNHCIRVPNVHFDLTYFKFLKYKLN